MAKCAGDASTIPEEQQALSAILEAHGLTEGELENASKSVQELEMFLQHYPKMLSLNNFPHLTSLKLIDQCIEKIEGLGACPKLRKLWLIENKISKIQGLEACTGLHELYLYSNRISKIEGLDHLSGLQVLWLADNYISSMAGLSSLKQLQQLNLARNDIGVIGTSLLAHTALTYLNLSDNKISSFQDVANLSKLTGLQELCLADPFWGDCPVAGLCNYQTFMLYTMQQLTSLDTLLLADETKAAAHATFTKKQLYYNMRIRTLRRAAAGLTRQAKAGCQVLGGKWTSLISQLMCGVKAIQRQLHGETDGDKQLLQGQLSGLQSTIQAVKAQQGMLSDKLTADIQLSAAALEDAVARLHLELGSGGNIRLEGARPDESWLVSCQELLRNRLIQAGEPGGVHGITDIQVVSASRIHNRHLRIQFEKVAGSPPSADSSDGRQCIDYLFYGEHPLLPGEMMRVVQHGFRPCGEYSSLGLDGAVRLASCVNLADQLRMQYAIERTSANKGGNDNNSNHRDGSGSVLEGKLIVCKVLLGGVVREADGKVQLSLAKTGAKLLNKAGIATPSACLDGCQIDPQQYPGASAVYRTAVAAPAASQTATALPQHRMWYLFDTALVLPEYLVTFRYTVKPGSPLAVAAASSGEAISSSAMVDSLAVAGAGQQQQQEPLLKLCARPLQTWLVAANQQQQQDPIAASEQQLQPGAAELEKQCKDLLVAVTAAAPRQQLAALAPAAISFFVWSQQLTSVAYLSLHDCGLTTCNGLLSYLPNLSTLVLSFNRLTGLDGLGPCSSSCQLTALDVSYNQISTWQANWLENCCKLAMLDASYNQLAEINQLDQLVRSIMQLQQLSLTGNPVQQHKSYQVHVAAALLQLQLLDGQAVWRPKTADTSSLLPALMKAGATQWHSETGPVAVLQAAVECEGWQTHLHSMVIEGKGLRSLSGISAASRLVCASFADNLLTGLAALQSCIQLRELNVSSNLICELGPLSALSSLHQLDVSFNSIISLLPLAPLTLLSQLSVEGNQLNSLAGLANMTGLLELYAANNMLKDIKEAERLAVLPRLVILDLVANPVVDACEDYRHLLLYKLRHLKVLDGVPAEAAELAAARAKYSGRLTMSFLEEQLGSNNLSAIRSLDVSSLRIRDVGSVFAIGTPFSALGELVLDNNTISSLVPLGGLTALQVLKLNNNRLADADQACISFGTQQMQQMQPAGAISAAQQPQQHPSVVQSLLPNLQVLHIASNGLTSLRPLQLHFLPGLRSLFVQGNELQRLDGLEGLHHLRELIADKNKIRVLEAETLSPLVRLRELRLEDNHIKALALAASAATVGTNASGAGCLPSLCVLNLGGNRLMDLNELEMLTVVPSLLEVSLVGNPLARKQVYRPLLISQCPQLQIIDGQQVTTEERENAAAMFAVPEPDETDMTAVLLPSAVDNRTGWAPLSVGPTVPSGSGINASFNRGSNQSSKLSSVTLPTVINYDAFAQMASNTGLAAAAGVGGLMFPGAVSSVPSIQAGVLVLSGAAAFGLEGMSIGNGSSNSRNISPGSNWAGAGKQRPVSAGRRNGMGMIGISNIPGGGGSPARRKTGPAGSVAGVSAQRQVQYRGY